MPLARLLTALAIGLALAPAAARAKDESCTYGVDCLCDRLKTDASVIFCEDFEDPALANTSVRGHWSDKYGPPVDTCLVDGTSVDKWRLGFYPDPTAVSQGRACAAQVRETSCEVSGQTDCVFQGTYSFGHRMQPGKNQGILGQARFKRTSRRFGMTMMIKWSKNYVAPGGGNGPAHKMNEFGASNSPLIGATLWSSSTVSTNHPFAGGIFTSGNPNPTMTLGAANVPSGLPGFTYFAPDRSRYAWGTTNNLDKWGCFQMHWDGWGTSSTRFRYWFNGTLIMDGRIDSSQMYQGWDSSGVGSFVWNNYYNGPGTPGDGYPGTTVAYRYEDNVVVNDGAEPVSCAAIGLGTTGSGSTPPPPPPLPSPVLLP